MAELIKLLILRGTEAQITSASNDVGKPYLATDTKRVYISDGTTKHLVGKVFFGLDANKPTAAALLTGMVYVATDTTKTYYCNGTAWVVASVTELSDMTGDLDDISDGSTYGKVKNTELSSGQVAQIRAVTGTQDITGDTLKAHLDNLTKHRLINDGGNGTTELWSANKIDSELNAASSGQSRQPKVIDFVDCTGIPPTEVEGDRYLLDFAVGTVHANWDGADKGDLVQFESSAWVIKIDASDATKEGTITYVDDENEDRILVNDGTPDWESRPTAITAHNDLGGLDTGSYRHLTAQEKKEATQAAGTDNESGLMTDTDKDKLDGIEAGADDNQDITAQKGTKRTDANPANGDAIIEVDFEDTGTNILAVLKGAGNGVAGTSDQAARRDHQHRLIDVDAGTL